MVELPTASAVLLAAMAYFGLIVVGLTIVWLFLVFDDIVGRR